MLVFFVCLLLPTLTLANVGTPVKLNADMADNRDVLSEGQLSQDGKWVVYIADQDKDQVFELYRVSITGDRPKKLNPDLVEGQNVFSFLISADSKYVVYLSDKDVAGKEELYSVPLGGGVSVKLSGLKGIADILEYKITPDSTNVFYTGQDGPSTGIFSNTITGRGALRYSNRGLDRAVQSFDISSNSAHVVFKQKNGNIEEELYSSRVGAGVSSTLKLNSRSLLGMGGRLLDSVVISADSQNVVYRTNQRRSDRFEIFKVPIVGGVRQNLTHTLSQGGVSSFRISPDSSYVVYRATQDLANTVELYSISINGGTSEKLNADLPANGEQAVFDFSISPDSTNVVYRADQEVNDVFELFSVPITGGHEPKKLNGRLVENGDVDFGYQISIDSKHVVYRADEEVNSLWGLYSVPIEGGATNTIMAANVGTSYEISPDGTSVLYHVNNENDNSGLGLYISSINGGAAHAVNNSLPSSNADIFSFTYSPYSNFAVYWGEQNKIDKFELYSVPIIGDELCLPITAANGNVAVVCL